VSNAQSCIIDYIDAFLLLGENITHGTMAVEKTKKEFGSP